MITEDQLVREIFKKSNTKTPMKDIDVILSDCFNIIRDHLKKGEQIYIADLGTFAPKETIKKSFVEVTKVANKK